MPWAQCSWPSGERMPKRNRPPGRASAFQDSTSKLFGPHQRARCAASVQTLKTRLRGASYSRSRTSTRSAGVTVVASLLPVMLRTLALQLAEIVAQAIQALLPEAPVVLEPIGRVLEGRSIEPARPPLRRPPAGDQAGALQHLEMLGDPGEAHIEGRRQLGY